MGLRIKYIKYLNHFIDLNFKEKPRLKMLELGNQKIRSRKKYGLPRTGKEYFQNLGMEHHSIDLNGLNGALKLDLSKPIDKWTGYFDVITNMGTTEHVEPFESQYECFKNIHNFLSVGGICVNIVPASDSEKFQKLIKERHCNNFYSKSFFETLSIKNSYELLNCIHKTSYVWVCYKKTSNSSFMEYNELLLSNITRTGTGRTYSYGKGGEFCFD